MTSNVDKSQLSEEENVTRNDEQPLTSRAELWSYYLYYNGVRYSCIKKNLVLTTFLLEQWLYYIQLYASHFAISCLSWRVQPGDKRSL